MASLYHSSQSTPRTCWTVFAELANAELHKVPYQGCLALMCRAVVDLAMCAMSVI